MVGRGSIFRGFGAGADGSDRPWKNCHQMKNTTAQIQTTSETQKLTRMSRKWFDGSIRKISSNVRNVVYHTT